MKKFLSLVLALIMTMSLVTISAGATEYKDLTDKDEIEYEEAVAVLNRIGVITGYDDGSFRPETELTRGAAAKIIVSLLIGPEAANNLPNTTAPYPDVPASHTFAGVISYCKTAGIISGYGDGTFKPANSLTGFAFAKMLLGALGYNSQVEGFVDTGWTMNVAKVGNVTGLFDRLDFDGAGAVSREVACQLALNTLKATMVTYGGTTVVTGAQTLAVQGTQAMYVTSNNRDINANINRRVISATNNELTLEFGEEHFKDLRLEHDRYDPAYDIYGHPSNEWSYKKVTIGTFKLPADFTYTKQMAHIEDTQATKEKALDLRGYDTYSTDHRGGYVNWSTAASTNYGSNSPFADATQIHINGWEARVQNAELYNQTPAPKGENPLKGQWYSYDANDIGAANKDLAPSLSEICDLTDNGVTVEVYVCPVDADFITDVVVTRTQLMEVDRIASDYVELDTIDSDSKDPRKAGNLNEIAGFNDYSLFDEVVSVKDNNYDPYNVLKDLKSGDEVAVIPYTSDNGKTWEVGKAYVPETVSGTLTNVDIYNTKSWAQGNAVGITVGGTTYPIAQWNLDMISIDATKIRATKKDVTLLLDEMGNALRAKDVGASDEWIVVGDYYQGTLTNGRVGWYVHGWTIKGDEVDLELGSIRGAAEKYAPGDLVKYQVANNGDGEYELVKPMYQEGLATTGPKGLTNGRRILKNGDTSAWTEDQGGTKTIKGVKYQTGEGIYNIAQFANKGGVAEQYEIETRNTLLPLEFYNTEVPKTETPVDTVANPADPAVHYDYLHATITPDVPVGTGAGDCGVLDGTETESNWYNKHGYTNKWNYLTAPYDSVKFIYVGFDSSNGNVEVINFLDGVQNVKYEELRQINRWWKNVGTNDGNWVASPAEAYVDDDGKVKAVVIKSDSAEANLKDLMIITDNRGTHTYTKSGAEAPASGTYNTYQYVSGEDNFKEEKTGYFDSKLSVGDVVIGTLQSNGIIRAKAFHATDYTNRNPDGLYVKGIEPLKTQEQVKTKTAFYIGKGGDEVRFLNRGVTGGKVIDPSKADILSNFEVLGVDYDFVGEKDYNGLVKVDSATQFIDLRDGRPGDINELSDLFDSDKCDNNTVELKLLLNGNKSSDGFRHAYAVMVLEAKPGATYETNPDFSIDAYSDSGDFTADKKSFEAVVGEDINLSTVWANEDKMNDGVTYKWSVAAVDPTTNTAKLTGSTTGDEAIFKPTKVGTYKVTLEITNPRVDKDEKAVKTATLTIVVKAKGTVTSANVKFADNAITGGATLNPALCGATVTGNAVNLFISLTAPDWARPDAGTAGNNKISFNVYANDQLVDSQTIQACTGATAYSKTSSGETLGTLTYANAAAANGKIPVGADVRVEITRVYYKDVAVKFVDESGNAITGLAAAPDTSDTAAVTSTATQTADATGFKFKLPHKDGNDASGAAVTLSAKVIGGVSNTSNTAKSVTFTGAATNAFVGTGIGAGEAIVTGNGPVVIEISNTGKLSKYGNLTDATGITAATTLGDHGVTSTADAALTFGGTLTLASNTNMTSGSFASVTVPSIAFKDAYGYTVTLTLSNGKSVSRDALAGAATVIPVGGIEGNVTITDVTFSAPKARVKATGSFNADKTVLTINFSEPIATHTWADSDFTAIAAGSEITTGATVSYSVVDEQTVTVTVMGGTFLTDIELAATKVAAKSDTTNNTNLATTFTLPT